MTNPSLTLTTLRLKAARQAADRFGEGGKKKRTPSTQGTPAAVSPTLSRRLMGDGQRNVK